MKFNELQVKASKKSARVGRGISAGKGKTAGRGTKGQKSRTGSSARPGFAGGQNPLMQQLPKLPGFRSLRQKAVNIYTGQLDQFAGKTVDALMLAEAGLISNAYANIKLIFKGDVNKKVTVKLPAASSNAVAALEAAGGTFEKTRRMSRPESKRPTSRAANKK